MVNLHVVVVLLKQLEAGSGPGSGRWVVRLLGEPAVLEEVVVVVLAAVAVVLLKQPEVVLAVGRRKQLAVVEEVVAVVVAAVAVETHLYRLHP